MYQKMGFGKKSVFFTVLLFGIVLMNGAEVSIVRAQNDHHLSNETYKQNVVQKISDLVKDNYVFPELAKTYSKEMMRHYEEGLYNSITEDSAFASKISDDLRVITHDAHFYVRLKETSDMEEATESTLRHPIRYHFLGLKENKGFAKLEWMEGNIGYLKLNRFYYYPDIRGMVNLTMTFLENANAIIIDIRDNGGGSGDYLSTYFLPHPTQLNSWYSRKYDFLTENWTQHDIGMEPLTDVPLFLLTSDRTFSAAESFAYDMKVRNRAIIIGDSTKGGAHSVDLYQINNKFEIYIPTVRAVNPVTGGNWEGSGVIPDILVPASSALDTAFVMAKKAGAVYNMGREDKLKQAVKEMEIHIKRAESLLRGNKDVEGNAALDSVFQVAFRYDLVNEFFMDVLAYNYLSGADEQILYAVLKKKIEFFPKSPSAFESLADAYFRNNKKSEAIDFYKKVLKLDPENTNASKMLKRLQEK